MTTYKDDFCRVVYGESVELERHDFSINGHGKTLYLRRGDIPFALVPHLSSRNGLNSHAALSKAAELIRGIL
ncbi:hypothetical protein [Asaia krungthepensis]|uniref:hypothetical protein n=1 Tax=Asaia krungthepensis TaxID=220990 RepID=UPI00223079C7|nr:hypothetical protein [Asaia krungthepensis]